MKNKIKSISKLAVKNIYPEIFDMTDGFPNNQEEAYEFFNDKDLWEDIEDYCDFKISFAPERDGWCDIYETKKGRIAVYGDGELFNHTDLFILEL